MKQQYTKLMQLNWQNIAGYSFFLFLIIWSVITKEERIYISDPAFYFFHIVNKADFFYPGVRYTAIINQFPLVIASKMQLPLNTLLTVYSVSFVLVRLFYFFLVNNILKNKAAAFTIIAITFVGVAESYFRPTSESTIALLNSIALYAWLVYANNKQTWGSLKTPILLIVTAAFIVFGYVSHPISLFSLLFVIVFFSIEYKKLKTIVPYAALLFVFVLFFYRVFLGDNNHHQNGVYANLIHSPLSILNELPGYYPFKFFKHHFKWIYYPFGILFFTTVFISLRKKKWLSSAFFVLFSVAYFIVACTSFKEGDANMQMEKIFLPNVMFAALTFAVLSRSFAMRNRQILGALGIIVIAMSMHINLVKYKPRYTQRVKDLHMMVEKADKLENRKLVITPKQIEHLPLSYCWAYGIETLIISSINEDIEPLTIFIAKDPAEIKHKMEQPENFMSATFQTSFHQKNLNPNYFKLPKKSYCIWDENFKNQE